MKQRSLRWRHFGSPKPKKRKQIQSQGSNCILERKGCAFNWFYRTGNNHYITNYCETFSKLCSSIKNRRRMLRTEIILLSRERRKATRTTETAQKFGWKILYHPLYSPAYESVPIVSKTGLSLNVLMKNSLKHQTPKFYTESLKNQKCLERQDDCVEKKVNM